jgi:uracil-DNA glycosylase
MKDRFVPLFPPLPAGWRQALRKETEAEYFADLAVFVENERRAANVYPPAADVFAALAATPPGSVRAVILGQDPYHGAGQAHGLAFSVPPGVPPPPSLKNVFRELASDVGAPSPSSGSLIPWAERGVLLLNAVLTVRAGEANSHRNRGWERFTAAALAAVADGARQVAFLVWGKPAAARLANIDLSRHAVIASAHPSPLSARMFLGSRPFSRANEALVNLGEAPIDWTLP